MPTGYAIAKPSKVSISSTKRKRDSLMKSSLHEDDSCEINISGPSAKFTFRKGKNLMRGDVGLADCNMSISPQPRGVVTSSFFIKLSANDFENAFPKIEIGSLFHDYYVYMDMNGTKGLVSISTIDFCQEMDIINEIGGGSHHYGGARYVEISGEII